MNFEWDNNKNLSNIAKHKVSFELASLVFSDPFHLTKFDRLVETEKRWHTVGRIKNEFIVVVCHTYREKNGLEMIRIISARKATNQERRFYEQG